MPGQKLNIPEQKLKFLACGREHSHIVTENELNGGMFITYTQKRMILTFFLVDTQLHSFGNNMYGQLGVGKNKSTVPGTLVAEQKPVKVNFESRIQHITCGLDHTIFATGTVRVSYQRVYTHIGIIGQALYGMGWSADGQLGQGKEDRSVPSKLPLLVQVDKLSTSTDFSLALSHDGQVWTWGNSEYGQGVQGRIIDRVNI
jgi:alpha-tubulin suppressor-like RCC1 family protein